MRHIPCWYRFHRYPAPPPAHPPTITHTTPPKHTHPYTTPSPRDRQDGVGTQAYLSSPTGLAVSKGNDKLYVADYSNQVIRVVYVNYNLLRCAPI